MLRFVVLAALAVFALAACQMEGKPTPVSGSDTSQNALDWPGTYKGVLPCGDCDGIETVLTLNADMTYRLIETYQGEAGKPASAKGIFVWDKAGQVVTLAEGRKFKVGEGRVWHLDMEGKVITGGLADAYVLTKTK